MVWRYLFHLPPLSHISFPSSFNTFRPSLAFSPFLIVFNRKGDRNASPNTWLSERSFWYVVGSSYKELIDCILAPRPLVPDGIADDGFEEYDGNNDNIHVNEDDNDEEINGNFLTSFVFDVRCLFL